MHTGLKHLFDEDQRDCLNQPPDGTPEYLAIKKKCKLRISEVKEILQPGGSFSGEDYFHGCIIFMHGDCPDDFWEAYNFALRAVDQNYNGAKRFAAAAFDRWLMYQGKPQRFGLQYVPDGVRLRLWDVDPETTDEERADWEVPTLEELVNNLRDVNERFDMSRVNMETKPQWLKEAIKRWNSEAGA